MEFIKMNGQFVEHQLIFNKRARLLSYVIKDGMVIVTVPPAFTEEQAKGFILENSSDILDKVNKKRENNNSPYLYVDGEKFFYRGRQYTLEIAEEDNQSKNVQLRGGHLFVYLPTGLDESEKRMAARSYIDRFYQKSALKILDELTKYYSKLMDIPYKPIKIKNQRTRWGSCSNSGNINLNWHIIMAPNQVIAYVVIHELAHLKFEDHSREFWALVAKSMPDYKRWKKWLVENSDKLVM
ncbi:MAG: M48 family metallopeptidase [Peptococcaceae bacterium]|nr:M48 family metallopeptidase [Peptococcaceae bacterium]